MIVDAAAYLGAWPFRDVSGSVSGLLRMMREHDVTHAVVSPLDGLYYQDPDAPNQRLMRALGGKPDLFAAPIVNARMSNWRARVEQMARNPQVKAIRLAPTFHGYPIADAREAAEWAAARGLAVAVQVRMLDERFHPPFLDLPPAPLPEVVELAAKTSRVRWIASAVRLMEIQQSAEQIRTLGNLWLDISHVDGLDCVQRACAALGPERLLCSTCWPFFYAQSAFLKMGEAGLPARQRNRVMGGNALGAFRLPRRRA